MRHGLGCRQAPLSGTGDSVSAPDILEVALWLQSRHGMHVFAVDHPGRAACPCPRGEHCTDRGKHPRGSWPRMATISPAVIRPMLTYDPPWNLAVACKQSCLLGVDEDRPGAFSAFAASVGETLEPTFTVTTAKGRHFYFRQEEGVPLGNSPGRLKDLGIDIRGGGSGDGGYLVAPGSVHQTGVVYGPVDSSAPILPVPGWLAEALRPAVPAPRRTGRPVTTFSALKGLVRVVLEAKPGERNNRLNWSAYQAGALVAEGRIDAATATAVLADAGTRTGLSEAEALSTIASGMRAGEAVCRG